MSKIPAKSYGQTKMVQYLTRKIDALRGLKSQKQIARELGYDLPNIVSMIKMGEARVPLEKVPALAKVLARQARRDPGGFRTCRHRERVGDRSGLSEGDARHGSKD